MLRLNASCVVENPVVRLQYCGGVLHSANDEPTLVAITTPRMSEFLTGRYIQAVCDLHSTSQVWYVFSLSQAKYLPTDTESRWYDRGELHRDYGPAVRSQHYWYKYHRGVQTASRANTYTGSAASSSRELAAGVAKKLIPYCTQRVCKYCAFDQLASCAVLSACAPVMLCIGANKFVVHMRMFQTCAGVVMLSTPDCDTDSHGEACWGDHVHSTIVGYMYTDASCITKCTRNYSYCTYVSHRLK